MQLAEAAERPCDDVNRIVEAHLHAVEEKTAKLTASPTELRSMLKDSGKERLRPTPEIPIIASAIIRAWITSADPPSDARMRQPQAADRGENSEPGEIT